MTNEILEIKKEIDLLKKRIELLENKNLSSESGKNINNEVLIKILNESIKTGTIKENNYEYLLDKNTLYNIANRYGIKKQYLNKNLFKIKAIVRNHNTIYIQRRINNKPTWLFAINKEKWLEELKKVNYGR